MDEHDLALRRELFAAFATGAPLPEADYGSLAAQHVVALDEDGEILMAHPFANHTEGARVDVGPPTPRTWWGNCAWDAFGIVAALDLPDATITAQGITLPRDDAVFHVLVPAAHWWDDIAFT
jgi:hypothetical protein